MRAKAGELLAYGQRDGNTGHKEVVFDAGEGVPDTAVELLRESLAKPRHTILCMLSGHSPDIAFIEDLVTRGYDLATLRFRISLKSAGAKLPKRLQRIRIRPATLHARWGRDPDDGTPDLCCAWSRPCARGDVGLFFGLFSIATYTPAELASRSSHDSTFRTKLEALNFDIRTLRFEVKKPRVNA